MKFVVSCLAPMPACVLGVSKSGFSLSLDAPTSRTSSTTMSQRCSPKCKSAVACRSSTVKQAERDAAISRERRENQRRRDRSSISTLLLRGNETRVLASQRFAQLRSRVPALLTSRTARFSGKSARLPRDPERALVARAHEWAISEYESQTRPGLARSRSKKTAPQPGQAFFLLERFVSPVRFRWPIRTIDRSNDTHRSRGFPQHS